MSSKSSQQDKRPPEELIRFVEDASLMSRTAFSSHESPQMRVDLAAWRKFMTSLKAAEKFVAQFAGAPAPWPKKRKKNPGNVGK